MAVKFALPNISTPVVDRSSGLMDEEWYRAFELFEAQANITTMNVTTSLAGLAAVEAVAAANAEAIGLIKSQGVRRVVQIDVTDPLGDPIVAGTGLAYFYVTRELHGYDLVDVALAVSPLHPSSAGIVSSQITNPRTTADMLLTVVSVDATKTGSENAATPPVIDPANSGVLEGDNLSISVIDPGTGAKGLILTMSFE